MQDQRRVELVVTGAFEFRHLDRLCRNVGVDQLTSEELRNGGEEGTKSG